MADSDPNEPPATAPPSTGSLKRTAAEAARLIAADPDRLQAGAVAADLVKGLKDLHATRPKSIIDRELRSIDAAKLAAAAGARPGIDEIVKQAQAARDQLAMRDVAATANAAVSRIPTPLPPSRVDVAEQTQAITGALGDVRAAQLTTQDQLVTVAELLQASVEEARREARTARTIGYVAIGVSVVALLATTAIGVLQVLIALNVIRGQ